MAHQQQPQAAPRKKGGGFALVLALVLGGALAAAIFAPTQIRSALGLYDASREPAGDLALKTQGGDQALSARAIDLPPRDLSVETRVRQDASPKTATTTKTSSGGDTTAKNTDTKAAGSPLLAEAERLLKSYQWEAAASKAGEASRLATDRQIKVRAERLARNAKVLQDLFRRLDQREELQRNVLSHPLLVRFTSGGEDTLAVPLVDFMGKETPQTDDPVGWINSRLSSTGKCALLLTKGGSCEIQQGKISDLRPAETERITSEAAQAFRQRLELMQANPANLRDPIAWYEAGRFAYQNRLDDTAVSLLERAIELDPFLADAIKNDRAQTIFLAMVEQIEKNQNRAAAAGWMAKLRKDYSDTTVIKQADAYYNNNLAALKVAREEALAAARKQQEKVVTERIKVAQEVGDQETASKLAAEKAAPEPEPEAPPVAALTGDAGKAQEACNKAKDLYAKANSLPPSAERDRLYGEAIPLFTQARETFYQLGMEAEGTEANMLLFACKKYRRAF